METAVLLVAVLALLALGVGLTGVHTQDLFGQMADGLGGQTTVQARGDMPQSHTATSKPREAVADRVPILSERNLMLLTIASLAACALILSRRRNLEKKLLDSASRSAAPVQESQTVFEKRQQILRILSNEIDVLFEGRIAVRHLMTRDAATVAPGQSTQEASDLLDERGVDYLLVCDKNGQLVGMLSRFYLQRSSASKVSEAMVQQPPCVAPDALLSPTVTQMINRRVSCVAVVVDRRPVGILTTTDVQLAMQCALQLLFKATSEKDSDLLTVT